MAKCFLMVRYSLILLGIKVPTNHPTRYEAVPNVFYATDSEDNAHHLKELFEGQWGKSGYDSSKQSGTKVHPVFRRTATPEKQFFVVPGDFLDEEQYAREYREWKILLDIVQGDRQAVLARLPNCPPFERLRALDYLQAVNWESGLRDKAAVQPTHEGPKWRLRRCAQFFAPGSESLLLNKWQNRRDGGRFVPLAARGERGGPTDSTPSKSFIMLWLIMTCKETPIPKP
jgi:hypothetical protein